MLAAAKNLGDGTGGMDDLLVRLRAREKARHGLQAKKDLDSSGLPIMTSEALRQVAIDDEGYETPELNDRLYLHFKGYRKIQNLEPYTSLKALWLGGNGLSEIQGINHLSQLRCLYLERNLISCIKGLDGLENLVQLDLSQNSIETAAGLSCLPSLHTLNLSKNSLKDADAVSPLKECPSLTNLDVTSNRLAGPKILDVISSLAGLVSLSLAGNPILAETAHFRKTVISASPKLRYLDRPVFEAEKVAAAAWTVGGAEAEREARKKYQEDKRNEDRKQMQIFRDWQAEQRRKKLAEIESRKALGLGDPEASPEEVRREKERAARAKADAEEDKRLIEEQAIRVELETTGPLPLITCLPPGIMAQPETTPPPPRTTGSLGGSCMGAGGDGGEGCDDGCGGGADSKAVGVGGGSDGKSFRYSSSSSNSSSSVVRGSGTVCGGSEKFSSAASDSKTDGIAACSSEDCSSNDVGDNSRRRDEGEELMRQKRVADSLAIYRAQLASERQQEQQVETLDERSVDAWEAKKGGTRAGDKAHAQREGGLGAGGGRSLTTWTQKRDHVLVELVRECVFDFEEVASRISVDETVADPGRRFRVTAEECRLRFAWLDREEGGGDDSIGVGVGVGVEAAPGVLENAGLSFDDLQRQAMHNKSRFLQPPTELPSTKDDDDDDDDDNRNDSDAGTAKSSDDGDVDVNDARDDNMICEDNEIRGDGRGGVRGADGDAPADAGSLSSESDDGEDEGTWQRAAINDAVRAPAAALTVLNARALKAVTRLTTT
eukprot:jgi/Undpi1/8403/HiC_scaffold_25.g10871.m1